jgi:hypothetical protein
LFASVHVPRVTPRGLLDAALPSIRCHAHAFAAATAAPSRTLTRPARAGTPGRSARAVVDGRWPEARLALAAPAGLKA